MSEIQRVPLGLVDGSVSAAPVVSQPEVSQPGVPEPDEARPEESVPQVSAGDSGSPDSLEPVVEPDLRGSVPQVSPPPQPRGRDFYDQKIEELEKSLSDDFLDEAGQRVARGMLDVVKKMAAELREVNQEVSVSRARRAEAEVWQIFQSRFPSVPVSEGKALWRGVVKKVQEDFPGASLEYLQGIADERFETILRNRSVSPPAAAPKPVSAKPPVTKNGASVTPASRSPSALSASLDSEGPVTDESVIIRRAMQGKYGALERLLD
jgi:hypothetical protein